MVAVCWLREGREFPTCAPIEVAAVDNDATHGGAMSADPFCAGLGDNIRT